MSYCVHCGVKLASYQKACPLCGTVVIDSVQEPVAEPRFIDKIITTDRHVNRHFLSTLIIIVSFIPVAVTMLVDFLISKHLSWSLYVLCSNLCCLTFFLIPYRYYISSTYWYIIFDSIVLYFFMLIIGSQVGSFIWVFKISFPLITLCAICGILSIAVFKDKKKTVTSIIGWTTVINSMLPLGINIIINYFIQHKLLISWAYWVTIPTFVLGLTLIFINRNEKVKEWIKKNIFI